MVRGIKVGGYIGGELHYIQPRASMVFERRRKITYGRQCRNLCDLKDFSWRKFRRLFYCGKQAIQFLLFPLNLRTWDKASLIDVSRSWTATRRCNIINTATRFARQTSRVPTCPFPNIMSAPLPRVGIHRAGTHRSGEKTYDNKSLTGCWGTHWSETLRPVTKWPPPSLLYKLYSSSFSLRGFWETGVGRRTADNAAEIKLEYFFRGRKKSFSSFLNLCLPVPRHLP